MGLSLSTDTGVISGIPTVSTPTYESIVVTIANRIGSKNFTLDVRVYSRFTEFSYPKKEYVFAVGDDATILPTANSEDVEYSLEGSLSKGIAFNKEDGGFHVFATTPTDDQSFTVVATNELGSLSCVVSFHILAKITQFAYPEAATTLVKGKRYSLVPSFDGTEVFFSVIHGSIPQGMTLNSYSGIIEGEPRDFFFKSEVILQARNEVGALETSLQLVVFPTSMPFIILILVVIVLVLVVVFYCICKKKKVVHKRKQLVRQKEVRMDIPNPRQMNIAIPYQMETEKAVPQMIEMHGVVQVGPHQDGGEGVEHPVEG